ncbi:AAA family ATPase [Archangium violaceum]|uniref:AAA family ATPase n=1 Tax=Archangium violaceum TaxID=83451 RepID=UPI002B284FC5|nr:AAA family ATPase [Archangium gephyra]
MKLTLRNLGRLREATIDLDKDLILLTGPNNTSKTYVAHALYGFGEEFHSHVLGAVARTLDELLPEAKESETVFRLDVVGLVDQYLQRILEEISRSFRGSLADILACSEEFVARAEARMDLDEAQLALARGDLLAMEDRQEWEDFGGLVRKVAGEPVWTFERIPTPASMGVSGSSGPPPRVDLPLRSFAYWHIATVLSDSLLGMPWYTYVLTAERAAIQLFSRELASKRTELVDDLMQLRSSSRHRAGSRDALWETLGHRARRYPLAIRDSLFIANDPAKYKARNSSFAALADQLEGKVLGGAIRIDKDGEMSFHPNESDARLSLHLSSSSVKALAGLSFFLRHIAEKNQFLIIDEPELNLHPDNQRRVARVLARLVRSGIKVLISTHSDYIIRELNNLIMLGADKDGSVRQRLGYDEAETLSPAQVGAYLFDAEKANPIPVTPTGIEVATIEREINALNTVSQDIYFTLFGGTGG